MKREKYEEALKPLQRELIRLGRWLAHEKQRVVVLIEGRDTAGKGGVIGAIADSLNPRQCHVVALAKPTEREAGQWYFQRYVSHLPTAGEIVLLDRSWYNRAGVERIMGYCTDAQYQAFLRQAPAFEKLLVDDGIHFFKYFLCCDQQQQEERLAERAEDPLKHWKLSPVDLEARKHYADYGKVRDAMLDATHTDYAPWTLVDFNDQRRGRLTLISDLLDRLPIADVPPRQVELPPLSGEPLKETYCSLRPIPDFQIEDDGKKNGKDKGKKKAGA